MAEPTSSAAAIALTAAGITLFGIATGLHPPMLLAGFFGGIWALSHQPPASLVARILSMIGSAMIAGYLAPVAAAVTASAAARLLPWWPADITREAMQFPVAFCIGFLGISGFGRILLRMARRAEARR
jgi:hypothetical protein